jgi:nucleoside-diphosphate-sugar epimerase
MERTPRRVVVTGGGGRIGRAVGPLLPQRWDVVATDLAADDGQDALDITDLQACQAAFAGADAVVHLAAVPDPAATWEQLLPVNVVGAHTVASAAADAGVRRLVLASSLHAVSALPDGTQSRVTDAPRPANLYGATKAWAEALGAWIAATTATSVVALRIGYFRETRPDPATEAPRELSSWLSTRDAAELVRAAVEAEAVQFAIANGISANRYRVADLAETTHVLGYRPVDDAWATE